MTSNDEVHRPERAEALKQKLLWEDLLNGPAWSMVVKFLADQKKVRITRLLTEPDLSDKELHFLRGEAATLELVEKYPIAMRDAAANVLTLLRGHDGRPEHSNGADGNPEYEPESRPRTLLDVDLPPDYTQQ